MPKSTGLYISDELFDQIAEVAKSEDRSWNQTAKRLLERGLTTEPAAVQADLVTALRVVLDQVDYTAGACRLNEAVSACLPKPVIEMAHAALAPFAGVAGE